jgi:hypothetical protein
LCVGTPIRAILAGATGKTIMRDYIEAMVGFEKLGAAVDTAPKA